MAKLPVLMYHNVSPNDTDSIGLTISVSKFEKQLQYIKKQNLISIFASEINKVEQNNDKYIVITFDDVTENQYLYALPLLKKYNVKATFFVPFAYIGQCDLWNKSKEKIMNLERLKSLDTSIIELGHHSYLHKRYADLSQKEIQEDFDKSYQVINKNGLNVAPILAFPYGSYPKNKLKKQEFYKLLEVNKIEFAFRIGNKVNKYPIKENFLIKRIDIKGDNSLFVFKLKLRFGKLPLF